MMRTSENKKTKLLAMNEELYWKKTLIGLEQGKQVAVVSIIERTGSAPNIPGAKMFVMLDDVMGTVGGGNPEHKLLNRARALLKEEKFFVEKVHMEHRESEIEESSGMICSGSQTFALIILGEQDKLTIKEIVKSYTKALPGVLTFNENGITFETSKTLTHNNTYSQQGTSWIYQENVGIQDRLFIIGGGHVSLALSRVMETIGFHITVLDDRKELPTMINNDYAHEKKVVSYDNISAYIPEGEKVYVTIMTFGHISDELVLESIIAKKCKYIGMMASKAKKQQIFENLEKKGISKNLLNKIYSPIGIEIRSHTPEEIAISIAAEIIKVRNAENEKS